MPAARCARGPKMTFFLVVSQGNSIGLWNSMPRSGAGPATGRPPTITEPWSEASAPATMRSRVDFPQPDGPSRQTSSPGATRRLIPESATVRRPALRNVLPTDSITTCAASGPASGRACASAVTSQRLLDECRIYVGCHHRRGRCRGEAALPDQELPGLHIRLNDRAAGVPLRGTEPMQLLAERDEREALRGLDNEIAGDALDLGALSQVPGRLRAGEQAGRLDLGADVLLDQGRVILDEVLRDRDDVQAGDAQLGDLLGVDDRVTALRDQLGFRPGLHVRRGHRAAQVGGGGRLLAGEADDLDRGSEVLQRQPAPQFVVLRRSPQDADGLAGQLPGCGY